VTSLFTRVVKIVGALAVALVASAATATADTVPSTSAGAAAATAPAALEVFTREGCPHCADAANFLADLQRERPELHIVVHDVGRNAESLARLRELAALQGISRAGVPAFLVGGELVIGFRGAASAAELQNRLTGTQPVEDAVDTGWFGVLRAGRLGLPIFTVALGLLDGFNPCAMWMLLFVLALLVNLRDRTRMALIGGTFVLVSGVVYFAFMAAWLNIFLLIGYVRAVEIALGFLAFAIGAVNVKDFVAFGRGPSLGIPEAAKPGVYARVRGILQAERIPAALAGAIVLAVLVNAIELLCTAGLPVLYTRILTAQALPNWQYYGYLALYNVAYMADDAVMLVIAVVTLGRRKLQEREGRWLKLVSGLVMLGLGTALLARSA
jgi:glutaredoxin